jgi:hypothetical protein
MNGSNSDEDAFRFHGVECQQPVTWPSPGRRIQATWQGDGPVDLDRDDVTGSERVTCLVMNAHVGNEQMNE